MEPARFKPGDRRRRRFYGPPRTPPPFSRVSLSLSPLSLLFGIIFYLAVWVDPRWKSRPLASVVQGPGGVFYAPLCPPNPGIPLGARPLARALQSSGRGGILGPSPAALPGRVKV